MPVRCALLLKLFEGQLGTMHLGRLTQGEDAGRIVLLRELGSPEANAIAAQIDVVRSITHPKLIKLLCLGQHDSNTYLVSEHVPGVALTELRSALRKQHTSVSSAVAVRITLDALRASFVAREVLCSMLGIDVKATFHPDSIWLAEFGEVFATPVPGDVSSGRTPYSSSASNSAPGILMELATGLPPAKVLAQGLAKQLPEPIARVLARALAAHAKGQSDMETLMAEALTGLPAKLIATEAEVAQELERIVGPRLHSRRLLLGVDQHPHDIPSEDDATFVTRLSAVENTPSGDEPTHIFRPYSGREADPDGATEMLSSRPPSPLEELAPQLAALSRLPSTPPPVWAAALLDSSLPREAPKLPSIAPAQVSPRQKSILAAALITAAAIAATVIVYLQR